MTAKPDTLSTETQKELEAMSTIAHSLQRCNMEERARILDWAVSRYLSTDQIKAVIERRT